MFGNIVSVIVGWVAAIIIVVFVVFIVKDAIEISKGQGSILKTVGKIITVFFLVGIVFACVKYEDFGTAFSNVASDAVNNVADTAGELFE